MNERSLVVVDSGNRGTCSKCGAMWRLWSNGTWSLLDSRQRPSACCATAAAVKAELLRPWSDKGKEEKEGKIDLQVRLRCMKCLTREASPGSLRCAVCDVWV